MLFNSFQFLFFFVGVWLLLLATRGTTRKIILLAASYYFYMCWSTRYIFVIWGITIIDYVAGLQIEKAERPGRRRLYLGISLFCNLSVAVPVQVFQFSDRLPAHRFASFWVAVRSAVAGDHSAGRSFLPHLSGHELHHRGLPQASAGGKKSAGIRPLRRLFPANGGRSD